MLCFNVSMVKGTVKIASSISTHTHTHHCCYKSIALDMSRRLVRHVAKSICTETMAWFLKKEDMDRFQINVYCVWTEKYGLWDVFPQNSPHRNTHTHTRRTAVRIGTALIALKQSCINREDFVNFLHFTTTSTSHFNMWNTSSTNPESVLLCFLHRAWILPELGLPT